METTIKSWDYTGMIQSATRVVVMGIFLGYMSIWVMMPTNTFWLHWLPRIHSATRSTYFGQQQGFCPSLADEIVEWICVFPYFFYVLMCPLSVSFFLLLHGPNTVQVKHR